MSALPNMRIYCPADARDAAGVLRRCLPPTAPTYVRLTARQDPTVFESSGDAHTGHGVDGVRVLRDGPGVLVLATGRCVAEAVAAVTNTDAAVGVVSCLRPFPDEQVRTLAAGRPGVVTVSEALALAGLGERVATALGPGRPPLADLCVDHRYPPVASHEELLTFYGVDRTAIRRAIDRLSRRETP
jgi:transketolase